MSKVVKKRRGMFLDIEVKPTVDFLTLENLLIIEKEKPDALLPTLGGQTALNLAMDLSKHGVLEKHGLECVYHAHISVGELHLRPVLNLKDPKDVQLFHDLALETAKRLMNHYPRMWQTKALTLFSGRQ